jgi:3-isopropylmalate/(R)-2-methylmalate dehydratase small subunit
MIRGRAHKFGDNIDTDAIAPISCIGLTRSEELGAHCMETIDPGFPKRAVKGDVIVAGRNFGCGSSREIAPRAIKGAGIECVIAESFARIFFRNAINIGLPVMVCPEAVVATQDGDRLEVDLSAGEILNATRGGRFRAAPYPQFIRDLIAAGGLVNYTRGRLARQSPASVGGK